MSTGREDEFRALFAEEARQRLASMTSLLLALEETGDERSTIAAIFRDAHTLKGGAGVVGVEEIGLVAHAMETVLEDLRAGTRPVTPAVVDALLGAVDGLQALLPSAIGGVDVMAEARTVERALQEAAAATAQASPPPAPPPPPPAEPAPSPSPAAGPQPDVPQPDVPPPATARNAPPPQPAAASTGSGATSEADSIRVPMSRLDEIVRLVGQTAAANLRVGRMVSERFRVDPGTIDELRELSQLVNELQERTMRARMVPVATITDVLHRAVRDVARATGKDVHWEVRGEETELDRGVLQQLADPLLHLVRNAVDHGIDTADERTMAGKPARANVRLHAMQLGSEVILTVTDDGRGIDVAKVRRRAAQAGMDVTNLDEDDALYLIFRSGLSTADTVSDISGRGVGLDVVRANVEAVRGRIEVSTVPGEFTEFRVIVPITLAVLPCLMVSAGGRDHAIPMHSIVIAEEDVPLTRAEDRSMVWVNDRAIPRSSLARTLGLPEDGDDGPVVVVAGLTRRHAFQVDKLIGQRDVVVKGLSRLVPRLDVVAGASVEPDGSIVLVLDVAGLIERARSTRPGVSRSGAGVAAPVGVADAGPAHGTGRRSRVLVVDDALTVRELQRSILERAGYEVGVAVDGADALDRLADGDFDLVLTDIEMPRMDGFELTQAIRAHPSLSNLAVLILTSRAAPEDRRRGLDVGADGYIVKSQFDEAALLSAVERLLA